MIDIESKVAETLHFDADRPMKIDGLRDGAIARAGALRRRRRMWSTVAAGGLAAAATAGVVVVPRLATEDPGRQAGPPAQVAPAEGGPAGPTTRTGPISPAGPTTLPEVVGVPTAGQQPSVVGTDPSLLHFDLNLAAIKGSTQSNWRSGPGYEWLAVDTKSSQWAVQVMIAADERRITEYLSESGFRALERLVFQERITIDGRSARLEKFKRYAQDGYTWRLTWQPVPGLHALIHASTGGKAMAVAAARALRLDHAQRCVIPARLTDVPAGAKWFGCEIRLRRRPLAGGRGVFAEGGVFIEQPDGHQLSVWFEDGKTLDHPHDRGWFKRNRTVAGRPAMWMIKGERMLAVNGLGPLDAGVSGVRHSQDEQRVTEAECIKLIEGVQIVGNLAKPGTWPQRAIG